MFVCVCVCVVCEGKDAIQDDKRTQLVFMITSMAIEPIIAHLRQMYREEILPQLFRPLCGHGPEGQTSL